MRPELEEIQYIEFFLEDKLSDSEAIKFQNRQKADTEFSNQVIEQQEIVRQIQKNALQKELQQIHQEWHQNSKNRFQDLFKFLGFMALFGALFYGLSDENISNTVLDTSIKNFGDTTNNKSPISTKIDSTIDLKNTPKNSTKSLVIVEGSEVPPPLSIPNVLNQFVDNTFPEKLVDWDSACFEHETAFQVLGAEGLSATISPDGKMVLYEEYECSHCFQNPVTANKPRKSIWLYSEFLEHSQYWTTPKRFEALTGEVFNPRFSYDGRKILFSMLNAQGNSDIYFLEKTANGWSKPQNFGKPINSQQFEKQASLSQDEKSLYFVRRPNKVGADWIYVSEKDEFGNWQKPKKLPAPINVGYDIFPNIMPNNRTLVFASDRKGGKGKYDLYKVEKAENNQWINLQKLNFLNTKGNDYSVSFSADSRQIFTVRADRVAEYYNTHDTEIFYISIPYMTAKNRQLYDTEAQEIFQLSAFAFDFNSAKLNENAKQKLQKLISFLSQNNTIKILIKAHTDQIGSDAFNLDLSEQRAQSVKKFLVQNGISSKQILTKGFGESQLKTAEMDEKSRQKNRRVEFEIVD